MKIDTALIYLFIIVLCFISCDKSVDTSAEFRERYVLTSIIDCNKDNQYAFVTRTYDNSVTGLDPETESVFIHGADVKLWYDYQVFKLKDTILTDNDLKEKKRYTVSGLNLDGDKFIEIEALLPNNLLLSSITKIPPISEIKIEETNADNISNASSEILNIRWNNIGNYIYEPKLVINYYSHSDSNSNIQERIIPLDVIVEQLETILVFPQPSNNSNINFEKRAVDYIMRDLSKNDPVKSNFVIIGLELQLRVYDENLTAYYSSTNQFLDQFSISLDSKLYSNIDGGLGIFGSFITKNLSIELDEKYITLFGYSDAK